MTPGAKAPDFSLETASGTTFRLSSQLGHPVVLYFYPQDDTEGCTIENMDFSRLAPDFAALGVTLVGISPDSVADHCKFRDKYGLGTTLASDPEHKAIGAFDLWKPKKTFGREYIGLVRTTVLIDASGRIAQLWTVTRIKNHAATVLEAAKALVQSPAN
ncbi:MAG TPA: peroxiredoxin [Devosiaceae bacterium]|jgi:peroxiredoxin Q/BCP